MRVPLELLKISRIASQSNAPVAKPEDGAAHQKDSSKATGPQEKDSNSE